MREKWRSVAALLGMAVLSACAQRAAPGVQTQSVPANISFGVPPVTAVALPAGVTFPVSVAAPAVGLPSLDPISALPPLPLPAPFPIDSVGSGCTPGGAAKFPTLPASNNVPAQRFPELGHYRWNYRGQRSDAAGKAVPLVGSQDRYLANLVKTPESTVAGASFTFDSVERDVVIGHFVTTTYSVALSGPASNPTVSSNVATTGLSLLKIVNVDPTTKTSTTFAPAQPLLLVPLPIVVGQTVSSVGVDPISFTTVQFKGTVGASQRVNACGQLIEGYPVTGTETIVSGTASVALAYTLVIAPQFGGVPIAETTNQSVTTLGATSLAYTVAQATPDSASPPKGSS
jgi:hypothetical protein